MLHDAETQGGTVEALRTAAELWAACAETSSVSESFSAPGGTSEYTDAVFRQTFCSGAPGGAPERAEPLQTGAKAPFAVGFPPGSSEALQAGSNRLSRKDSAGVLMAAA